MSFSTHLLDARDLELLSHYLSHTSRTIAFDRDDLYALHVGIPNLAFSSKALMSSTLALAAAVSSFWIQFYPLQEASFAKCGQCLQ